MDVCAEGEFILTKVGDPDGDPLIENVEDHNHDKADERGGDGCGHLRRHVLLQGFQLLQVLSSESSREGKKCSQAIDSDGHNGRDDQQNLNEKIQLKKINFHQFKFENIL